MDILDGQLEEIEQQEIARKENEEKLIDQAMATHRHNPMQLLHDIFHGKYDALIEEN